MESLDVVYAKTIVQTADRSYARLGNPFHEPFVLRPTFADYLS
jgi:hypothetical protein